MGDTARAILATLQWEGRLPVPKSRRTHEILQAFALAAIIYSFCSTHIGYVYDTTVSLVACLATTFLIYSLSCPTLMQRWLSSPLIVYAGKRSYSLYLYHWPIIVFLKLYDPQPKILWVLFLTWLCAEISYRWIETPFRYEARPFRLRRSWLAVSALPAGLLALAAYPHPFAVTKELRSLSLKGIDDRGSQYDIEKPRNGMLSGVRSWTWDGVEPLEVLLVGSSHASSMVGEMASYSQREEVSFVSLARSFEGVVAASEMNRARVEFAKSASPHTIILFSHFTREIEEEGVDQFLQSLGKWSELCQHLIVVDSPPQIKITPKTAPSLHHYLVHLDLTGQKLEVPVLPRDTGALRSTVEALPNASWVDLMDKFSENGICKFLPDGSFPYADLYHLNFLGIRYLIEDELGELLLQGFAPMHSECEADRKSVYK